MGDLNSAGPEKWEGLQSSLPRLREMAMRHEDAAEVGRVQRAGFSVLTSLLHMSLWGNQADSSLWAAGSHPDQVVGGEEITNNRLLVDDSAAICATLLAGSGGRGQN